MSIIGKFMVTRDASYRHRRQKKPVAVLMTEHDGYLMFKFDKRDLIPGNELRLELKILDDDDA